ncbi:MAG: hypothetical protein PHU71_04215 [Candidatus Gracilibacteria bacterium]|nr:hypothetical protein [Candidatus Gracilibacteria bacterium]
MTKSCTNCSQQFEVTEEDLKFYDKVSPVFNGKKYPIPAPTLCPDCRAQRRMSVRNERNLYHRKCDLTGKTIVSIYSPDKPFKVYYREDWWSDKWDPLDYGQDFDFEESFFTQFSKLLLRVPLMSLFNVNCENSEYVNLEYDQRNCYMTFTGAFSEDCYYSHYLLRGKNCVDCKNLDTCERCYELSDSSRSYECLFSMHLQSCSNCLFCYDCQSCKHCFGSYNLRHAEYYFFNQKMSAAEYFKKISELKLGSFLTIEELKNKFNKEVLLKAIHKYAHIVNSEKCTGDYIKNSQNCTNCFEIENSRDLKHVTIAETLNDSQDCYVGGYPGELCYECMSQCVNVSNNLFCNFCWEGCHHLLYCDNCFSCQNCFACIGLRHKEYCILNKQYSKAEYEELIPKIIEHMETLGEWGEFFPVNLSPFAYNETVAQEYFPLTKEEALNKGYQWKDEEDTYAYQGPKVEIPDSIEDVQDTICEQILTCEQCAKHYKVIKQELKFYRKLGLPVPRKCPNCRHQNRMALRNPRKLWDRKCAKCEKEIQTSYAPERPEIVYCEKCYLAEVY